MMEPKNPIRETSSKVDLVAYERVPELEAAGWPRAKSESAAAYCAELNGTELGWLVWSSTADARLIAAAWAELRLRDEDAEAKGGRHAAFLEKLKARKASL